MHVKKYLVTLGAPLGFLLCVALLIHVLIEGEQGKEAALHPADAIILFSALCGLIVVFLIARALSGNAPFGLVISNRARRVITLCVLLLLPQSTVLMGRLDGAVHSDVTLFALYNMIDVAVGRLLLSLLRKRTPLLPGPQKKLLDDRR